MNCPVCRGKKHVELDMQCDGFAEVLEECGICGSVWTLNGTTSSVLNGPTEGLPQGSVDF